MILIDTGPLVALVDQRSAEFHKQVGALVQSLPPSLMTTWPCLTEALYLLSQLSGWMGQARLRTYLTSGIVSIHQPGPNEWERAFALMEEYRDTPMDFADASLVVLAEQSGARRILTLDSDFYFYRTHGKEIFEVIALPVV
jgi:predicted nucleic acid-binding protein